MMSVAGRYPGWESKFERRIQFSALTASPADCPRPLSIYGVDAPKTPNNSFTLACLLSTPHRP